jgi:outer membrane protein assembly factor BamB
MSKNNTIRQTVLVSKKSVTLILLLSITLPLITLSTVSAGTLETYSFIGATPNPVGVGTPTLLHVGVTIQLTNVNMGWERLSVTVTKPDGATETLSNIKTDSTGGTGVVFTPTMIGNYTLQTHFPEQTTTTSMMAGGAPAGTVMLASNSDKLTLIVKETVEVPTYPTLPLPTEYWSRPINAQLREWTTIAGNWAGVPTDRYVLDNDFAPETGHVLWTKELSMGGLVGGSIDGMGGPVAFENGAAYEQKFGAPVAIGGILYFNRFEERGTTRVDQEVVAVDLHTGKELWTKNWNNTRLDLGQAFYWQSYNYMGTLPFLWEVTGTTWRAFDAFTGRWIYNMTNVPATISSYGGGLGSNSWYGDRGEIYAYSVSLPNGWLALWNSSRVVSSEGGFNPHGNTYNCTWASARHGGYEWNITIPKNLPGSISYILLGDKVVGASLNTTQVNIWALSLKPGQEGQLIFQKAWNAPSSWSAGNQTLSWQASRNEKVGLVWSKETYQWYGFNLETGEFMWGPTIAEQYLATYGTSTAIADGKLYECYMSGIVYCFDIKTGNLLWTYNVVDPLNEVLWGENWPMRIQFVAAGKLYLCEGEHSPNQPLPRGGPMLCLNATTGEKIWQLTMSYYYRTNIVMADNIIGVMNSYDQQIYAIGKGPSTTTVSAPDVSIDLGKSIMIKGTVTDVSSGTLDYALKARFPNGVAAVSDESVSAWMEYVYMQMPRPLSATGVPVTIDVIDANGNYRNIGTATTDTSGVFNFDWKPDISGKYTVIATFVGSKAYYPSYSETGFVVDENPETTPQPTQVALTSMADTYLLPGIAAIIIVIVLIGAMIMLMLRKRP